VGRTKKITLDEFLQLGGYPFNSYIRLSGWKRLYIRRSNRRLGADSKQHTCIDLANIASSRPGKGAFRRLIARLRRDYPQRAIFVENVLTEQFCEGLRRMGFTEVQDACWGSFYLLPDQPFNS
jgi:hypothetical protein